MWTNRSRLTGRLVSVQALTQYHLVLLAGGRLHAVNRVSGKPVQELALGRAVGGAPALGLATDQAAGTIYLFTGARSQPPAQPLTNLPALLLRSLNRLSIIKRDVIFVFAGRRCWRHVCAGPSQQ